MLSSFCLWYVIVHALIFCGSPMAPSYRVVTSIGLLSLSTYLVAVPNSFRFLTSLSLTEFSSQNEPIRHPGKTVRADVPNKRSDILHSHTDSAHFPTVSSDRRRFERYNPSYRTVWTIKRSSRVNHSPVLAVKSALPGATRLHGL